MKASELVRQLEKVLSENGDIEVRFASDVEPDPIKGDSAEIVGISTLMDEEDKAAYFLICDNHTMEALV